MTVKRLRMYKWVYFSFIICITTSDIATKKLLLPCKSYYHDDSFCVVLCHRVEEDAHSVCDEGQEEPGRETAREVINGATEAFLGGNVRNPARGRPKPLDQGPQHANRFNPR